MIKCINYKCATLNLDDIECGIISTLDELG
jgi:hypothetical protein